MHDFWTYVYNTYNISFQYQPYCVLGNLAYLSLFYYFILTTCSLRTSDICRTTFCAKWKEMASSANHSLKTTALTYGLEATEYKVNLHVDRLCRLICCANPTRTCSAKVPREFMGFFSRSSSSEGCYCRVLHWGHMINCAQRLEREDSWVT